MVSKSGLQIITENSGDKTPSIPPALDTWLHHDTTQIASALTCFISSTNHIEASPQCAELISLLVKGMLPSKDHVQLICWVDTGETPTLKPTREVSHRAISHS